MEFIKQSNYREGSIASAFSNYNVQFFVNFCDYHAFFYVAKRYDALISFAIEKC